MGKRIRVTPEEMEKASNSLKTISETYTEIYKKLFQEVGTMGEAWEGEDNIAFVNQINGFSEELKQMADKIMLASTTLKQQKDNYVTTQQNLVTEIKKLAN